MLRDVWGKEVVSRDSLNKVDVLLLRSKEAFQKWNRQKNRGDRKALKKKTERLKELQEAESKNNVEEIRGVKKELQMLLEKEESAFIPGRMISDNILVAYELLHSMKIRRKWKVGNMAIKLDMSKAYDRIEWAYVEAMLRKLGFCERWVYLIMKCISSVSFSVLINGKPEEKFYPSRGLRQGDPLSPYLFILCAEGLSGLLNEAERKKETKGVQVARGGVSINHLLFADDCILFGRARLEEWNSVQRVLGKYEKALGQFLNKEKTSIFFSSNTQATEKKRIKEAGGVVVCGKYEKYLGLPAFVGRSKYNTFRILKEMIWQKISNWKNNFLSQAGREVLIKAVLQAIPTYTMSVFKLPLNLCDEITTIFSKFWWGRQNKEGSYHWRKWDKMGGQKRMGGMGFRDLSNFNLALLAKQGWRFIQNPHSLAAVVFKEKYFKDADFLNSKVGVRPSLIWRCIKEASGLLKEGLRWRVGNGKKIQIWRDKWMPKPSSFLVQSPISILREEAKVEELICDQQGCWKADLVMKIFKKEEAEMILSMPLSRSNLEDKMFWGPSTKGVFTVKSAYYLQLDRLKRYKGGGPKDGDKDERWRNIWGLNVPNSVKSKVQKCKRKGEGFLKLWEGLMEQFSQEQLEGIAVQLRRVWMRRNEFVFEKMSSCPRKLIAGAKESLEDFRQPRQVQSPVIEGSKGIRIKISKWVKPKAGFLKINWDASLDVKQGVMGMGIIIRNDQGEAMVAACDSKKWVQKPYIAECCALWKAMEICRDLNLQQVIFEGDAKTVITAVDSDKDVMSSFGPLIVDIRKVFRNRSD
ncbi:uncharacterized protein LOC122276027 [Carya illinoinensis]|uniref:uncharacterized protein LOC122276027 n=1 Tax=Carya illinoinensis TaxID=32201 RepID=UPI001C729840|nr:uncharacterized protein LOC122276027 [Carya illinoinensis]